MSTDSTEHTDGRGKFPSRGIAGKLKATRNAAPEGATEAEITDVAWTALDRGVHPREVWAEKWHRPLDEF